MLKPTFVMVLNMSCRSSDVGKPTYNCLSKRPGRSTAGSMMSVNSNIQPRNNITQHTDSQLKKGQGPDQPIIYSFQWNFK